MGLEKDYHLYVKMHDLHFNDNKEIEIILRLLLVIAMYCQATSKPVQ